MAIGLQCSRQIEVTEMNRRLLRTEEDPAEIGEIRRDLPSGLVIEIGFRILGRQNGNREEAGKKYGPHTK